MKTQAEHLIDWILNLDTLNEDGLLTKPTAKTPIFIKSSKSVKPSGTSGSTMGISIKPVEFGFEVTGAYNDEANLKYVKVGTGNPTLPSNEDGMEYAFKWVGVWSGNDITGSCSKTVTAGLQIYMRYQQFTWKGIDGVGYQARTLSNWTKYSSTPTTP